MSSSAQLEREAEETRGKVVQTLDELRERITPGQLVDQCVDYAKASGGGDFARNLGRQMANNPLPVCLIGAGIAWLMLASGKRSDASMRMRGLAEETGDAAASGMAQASADMQSRIGDAASK